jgi:hypothetical protein
MSKAPTVDQLTAADEYASSKLCVQIPSQFGSGLTLWDSRTKKCKITETGCFARVGNPISYYSFTSNGTHLDWKQLNVSTNMKKFWELAPPQHLVWKTTSQSPTTKVCARANYKLQQFCEFPAQRTSKNSDAFGEYTDKGYVTQQPGFKYKIVNGKETCIIGKDYCDSKGISYDPVKGECYVNEGQKVGELLLSSYLVREMNGAGYKAP